MLDLGSVGAVFVELAEELAAAEEGREGDRGHRSAGPENRRHAAGHEGLDAGGEEVAHDADDGERAVSVLNQSLFRGLAARRFEDQDQHAEDGQEPDEHAGARDVGQRSGDDLADHRCRAESDQSDEAAAEKRGEVGIRLRGRVGAASFGILDAHFVSFLCGAGTIPALPFRSIEYGKVCIRIFLLRCKFCRTQNMSRHLRTSTLIRLRSLKPLLAYLPS